MATIHPVHTTKSRALRYFASARPNHDHDDVETNETQITHFLFFFNFFFIFQYIYEYICIKRAAYPVRRQTASTTKMTKKKIFEQWRTVWKR